MPEIAWLQQHLSYSDFANQKYLNSPSEPVKHRSQLRNLLKKFVMKVRGRVATGHCIITVAGGGCQGFLEAALIFLCFQTRVRPSMKSSPYSAATDPPYSSHRQTSYASPADIEVTDSSSMDPDLARYLNRSYWEERNERQTSRERSSPSASAPVQTQADNNYTEIRVGGLKGNKKKKGRKVQRDISEPMVDVVTSQISEVSEAMVKTFHNNVEMLLERMQKVSGQGKHIAMDATVQ
ncbi:hypothetical protein OS493_040540, partial [Desmophyllum pertusum]